MVSVPSPDAFPPRAEPAANRLPVLPRKVLPETTEIDHSNIFGALQRLVYEQRTRGPDQQTADRSWALVGFSPGLASFALLFGLGAVEGVAIGCFAVGLSDAAMALRTIV